MMGEYGNQTVRIWVLAIGKCLKRHHLFGECFIMKDGSFFSKV